jgi:cell wall-associated NlpC family hydrolase
MLKHFHRRAEVVGGSPDQVTIQRKDAAVMGTQATSGRRVGNRVARRLAAVIATVAVGLVVAPGTATAAPMNPSDGQLSQAQQAKSAAAAQVSALTTALADAQAQVDSARAESAIALDTYQGKQADYETAKKAADEAAATAERARKALAAARADVADFARQSYQQGSTSPTLEALMTSAGPADLVERAALLQAAGSHQADVVVRVTAAEADARAADAAAKAALDQAATLKQQAADALSAAEALEVSARRQAATIADQQAAMQQQLDQAQQTLVGLEGARAAAQQYAAAQAAAAAAAAAASSHAVASSGTVTTAGAGRSSAVETAISSARRYLGTIYAWGGGSVSGPSAGWGIDAGVVGFDCSGLTRYAYARAGITIPRNSSAQYLSLPRVSRNDLQRGDLVFWATDTSRPSTIHHVAIYLGGGQILEAPQSGSVIRVSPMRWAGFIGGARPSA